MKKELENQIHSNNYRVSKNLKAILKTLEEKNKPLTISEIQKHLSTLNLKPNKTTLYRQVEKLKHLKLIQENIFSDSIKRYCKTEKKEHHHHFFCKKCGYSEELPKKICKSILTMEKLFIAKKFKISNHNFELEGLCAKCNKLLTK